MMLSICRLQESSLYEQYTVHLTNQLGLLWATKNSWLSPPVLEQSPVGSTKLEGKKKKEEKSERGKERRQESLS